MLRRCRVGCTFVVVLAAPLWPVRERRTLAGEPSRRRRVASAGSRTMPNLVASWRPARRPAKARALNREGVLTRLRHSAGQDVEGGCGQLRARESVKPVRVVRARPPAPVPEGA